MGLLFVFLFASPTYAAISGTIYPTNDARISDDRDNENFGASEDLTLQSKLNNNWMSFIQFNLPNSSVYISADFHFYNRLVEPRNLTYVTMYYCNNSFDEMTIKWSNYETYITDCDTLPFYNYSEANYTTGWNTTELTAIVRDDVDKVFTIMMKIEPQNFSVLDTYVVFQSKESAHKPYIEYSTTASFFDMHILREDNITKEVNETFTIELLNVQDNLTYINTTTNNWLNFTYMEPGDYEIRYYNDNHKIRSRYFTSLANETITINLYALNTTDSDILDVVIRDFTLSGISNATLSLQRWYSEIGAGLTVAEGVTNTQGKYRFYIDRGDAFYRINIEYGGVVIYTTSWDLIQEDTYRITTDIEQFYTPWVDMDGILSLYDTALPYNFEVLYSNKDSYIDYVCLAIIQENKTTGMYTVINDSCLSTLSGSISITFNETYNHIGVFYVIYENGVKNILDSLHFSALSLFEEEFGEEGIFIAMIIVVALTLGTLYVSGGNPIATLFGFDIGIIFVNFVGLYVLNIWALGIIIPGSFVVMFYLNKKGI